MVLEMVTPFTCFPTPAPAACLAPEPIIIRLGKERHRLSLSLVAPMHRRRAQVLGYKLHW